MKALKFFAVVIAAFAILVACEEQRPEPGQNSGGNTPDTPQVENPDTPQVVEKLLVELVWGDASEVNGKTYEVGMANYDPLMMELQLPILFTNGTEEDKQFKVKEVRNYNLASASASLCTNGQCMPGDMTKKEQEYPMGQLDADEEMEISLHLMPYVETATTFSVDFTITDGIDEVTFTVNYNYNPAK